jgi:hypothetical protein
MMTNTITMPSTGDALNETLEKLGI